LNRKIRWRPNASASRPATMLPTKTPASTAAVTAPSAQAESARSSPAIPSATEVAPKT
jgi:hypothetical protein